MRRRSYVAWRRYRYCSVFHSKNVQGGRVIDAEHCTSGSSVWEVDSRILQSDQRVGLGWVRYWVWYGTYGMVRLRGHHERGHCYHHSALGPLPRCSQSLSTKTLQTTAASSNYSLTREESQAGLLLP